MKPVPIKIMVTLFFLVIPFCGLVGTVVVNQNARKEPLENIFVEKFFDEEVEPLLVDLNTGQVEGSGVYVPYYWENGLNVEEKDYLKGYIPSITSFKKYWSIYKSTSFGKGYSNNAIDIDSVLLGLDFEELRIARGIKNEASFFTWDEDCKTVYKEEINEYVFVCPNWINWTGESMEDKSFVLVECVKDKEGYCLFEDYLELYYLSKSMGENRCFNSEEKYLCSFEAYIKQVNIK